MNLVDFDISADHRLKMKVKVKESEKNQNKCMDLAKEFGSYSNFSQGPKNGTQKPEKRLEELEITGGIQTI